MEIETKVATVSGTAQVGVVAGYFSTWDEDRGGKLGVPDQFVRGAWERSLAEHRARGNRQVRVKDGHGGTIGGAPIDRVREDSRGLYGEAHINLESAAGRELYSLVQQGVITDFSVGYTVPKGRDKIEGGVRKIYEARLWEVSLVDEPANPEARILEVRQVHLRELESTQTDPLVAILRNLQAAKESLRGSEHKRGSVRSATSEELLDRMLRDLKGMSEELRRDRKRAAAHALDQRDDLLRRIDTALQLARQRR